MCNLKCSYIYCNFALCIKRKTSAREQIYGASIFACKSAEYTRAVQMENNWRLRLCIMRAACIHLSYNVAESCYVNVKEVLPNDIRNTIGKQFENGLGSSLSAWNVWPVILYCAYIWSCVAYTFATEGNWKFASKRLHIMFRTYIYTV